MTTNIAIVDDQDRLIHYAGAWIDSGTPPEFNSTTKVSVTQGSTASFTFFGTSVTVYGSVSSIKPPQASMSFVIDNSITGSYTPPANMTADVHHEALYTSPPLSNGSHTLIITQTEAQLNGVIFLDYILYETSLKTSTDVGTFFVDDRDSRIQYSPVWDLDGSDQDFMHTLQGSPSAGATLTLEFEGRGISMYGAISNGSAETVANASMVIDGGKPVFFVPPEQSAAVTNNNLIFKSGVLADGNHTVIVTAENNVPDHPVWVDYFLITPPAGSPSGSNTSSTPSSGPGALRPAKSTIIGSAVGAGVALLFLCVALIFFVTRRRRQRRRHPHPTPIDLTSSPVSMNMKPVSPPSSSVHGAVITPFFDFGTSSTSVDLLLGGDSAPPVSTTTSSKTGASRATPSPVSSARSLGGTPDAPLPMKQRLLRADTGEHGSASGSSSGHSSTSPSLVPWARSLGGTPDAPLPMKQRPLRADTGAQGSASGSSSGPSSTSPGTSSGSSTPASTSPSRDYEQPPMYTE